MVTLEQSNKKNLAVGWVTSTNVNLLFPRYTISTTCLRSTKPISLDKKKSGNPTQFVIDNLW